MKKLTLTVTEETHRSARVWATQCNTSVSALVRNFLEILQSFPCPGVDIPGGSVGVSSPTPHPPANADILL
jgi:Family of unknown function (DUF6364)